MMKMEVRPIAAIVASLESDFGSASVAEKKQATAVADLVPALYVNVRKRVGVGEIAADFTWPSAPNLNDENRLRDCPLCGLGRQWWLFSVTGTGDAWLVRRAPRPADEVSFLNHDEESRAIPHSLGISFGEWLQLADVMRQVDRASKADRSLLDRRYRPVPEFEEAIRAALARVSPSLSRTYPLGL